MNASPPFPTQGHILPKGAASLRSLTATMAVMCYLACLAAGALFLVNKAVGSWTNGLAASATVQISEAVDRDIEADVAAALKVLSADAGVASATALDGAQSAALLEPWLGRDGLDLLPVPRVIALVLTDDGAMDFADLSVRLTAVAPTAVVDNHKQWSDALSRMAVALSLLAVLILGLIALSAMAMVVFATRAVLDANRTTVDVLHVVGAEDRFIAKAINRLFLRTGLVAGAVGVILACLTFYALSQLSLPGVAPLVDAGAEVLAIDGWGRVIAGAGLLAVPLAFTGLALATSRLTLMRMLERLT
jgi:cell division transport system permease protein